MCLSVCLFIYLFYDIIFCSGEICLENFHWCTPPRFKTFKCVNRTNRLAVRHHLCFTSSSPTIPPTTVTLTFMFLDACWMGSNSSGVWRQEGSLRWRGEGPVKGKPCTKVQVCAGFLSWSWTCLWLFTPTPSLSLSPAVPLPGWMALFVFLSNTQSPAD